MKKTIKKPLLVILAIMVMSSVYAQDSDENDGDSFKFNSYFGVDFNYTDALDINPFLSESGVPTVRRLPVGFSFGFTTSFSKNKIDLDFSFYTLERERGDLGHEFSGLNFGLRYLRQVHEFEKGNFISIGASATYFASVLEFYDKSETIDLDNPGNFGDVAKLKNGQLYLGPTLAYSVFSQKNNEEYIRFQLTYDFNITQSDWDSDYAGVDNSFGETGNRLRLQLLFPF